MTNIKIVTDSSCIIPEKRMREIDIYTISLSILINDTVYADQNDLDPEEFMSMMQEAKELPKTSQPSLGEFVKLYDELGKDGSQVISIHLTEKLSGTVNTARQAAAMTKTNVTVIDSEYIDQALGFQVYEAAICAKNGGSIEEVVKRIETVKANTSLYIGVSTLENLVKGGRISKVTARVSGMLNLRLLMKQNRGELDLVQKGRGNKTFLKWSKTIASELSDPSVVYIGFSEADGKEISEEMKTVFKETLANQDIPIIPTTPLVATHTGKGAFAVMYYVK